MLEAIRRRVQREGLDNVSYVRGELDDPKLRSRSVDVILIVDAYHEVEHPHEFLRNVASALKPSGRIGIVGFRLDGGGPGPPLNERKKEEEVVKEAGSAGLRLLAREGFLDFEYLLIFGR
jgi:ubiquinone/menaquinone biosynthesis C-methylase UbiE